MPLMRAAVLLALLASAVDREQPGTADRLLHASVVKCSFEAMARGRWQGVAPEAIPDRSTLTLEFHDVNADEGTARAITPLGASEIIARASSGALHFVQIFANGPLFTTTVWPVEGAPGRLLAVHSRHEYTAIALPGYTSRPEQYYGTCAIEQ